MKIRQSVVLSLALLGPASAFTVPSPQINKQTSINTALFSSTSKEASDMLRDMREELGRNEEANMVMQALRGQNLNDDDSAVAGLQMQLIDGEVEDKLPYNYDPIFLQEFFGQRPGTVVKRFFQLSTVLGDFVFKVILDKIFKRLESNPDLEIQRAGELRDKITSLGPFYIKVRRQEDTLINGAAVGVFAELTRACFLLHLPTQYIYSLSDSIFTRQPTLAPHIDKLSISIDWTSPFHST